MQGAFPSLPAAIRTTPWENPGKAKQGGPALESGVLEERGLAGHAHHVTASKIRCRGCDRETHELFQAMEGLSIGEPLCRRCTLEGLPPCRRAQATRRRGRKS